MTYYPIDEKEINIWEFEYLKRNVVLTADMVEPNTIIAQLFWCRIKILISKSPMPLL